MDDYGIHSHEIRFIREVKTDKACKTIIRQMNEGSMDKKGSMNFSEYVAILSDNTELLEKAQLEKKIALLESERQAFIRGKSSSRYKLEDIMKSVEKNSGFISRISKDVEAFNAQIRYQSDGVTRLNPIILDRLQDSSPQAIGTKLNELLKKSECTEHTRKN